MSCSRMARPCSKGLLGAWRKNWRRWLHPRWRSLWLLRQRESTRYWFGGSMLEIGRGVKEKMCYIASGYDTVLTSTTESSDNDSALNVSVVRMCCFSQLYWWRSQWIPRHFFPRHHEVRSCSPQEFVRQCRVVMRHEHFPRDGCGHNFWIDGVCSIHDEVKVVAPPRTSSLLALFSIAPKCFPFFSHVSMLSSGGTTMFAVFFDWLNQPCFHRLSWRRGINGQMKNQNSIIPEDYEEFISLTLRTRNSERPFRMLARNWKHQWLPLCPAKLLRARRIVGVVHPIKSKQNLRVFQKLVNLQDCIWENHCRLIMKTILQEKEIIHYSITIWFTDLTCAATGSDGAQDQDRKSVSCVLAMMGTHCCAYEVQHKNEFGCYARTPHRWLLEYWWIKRLVWFLDRCHSVYSMWRETSRRIYVVWWETDKTASDIQTRSYLANALDEIGKKC